MVWTVCYRKDGKEFLEIIAFNENNAIELVNKFNSRNDGKEYFVNYQEDF